MNQRTAKLEFILAVTIYGTIGMFLRYIHLPSEVVVLCRGVIGSLFIAAFMLLTGKRFDFSAIRSNIGWLLCSGMCLGLNWVFLFSAYNHTTIAIASLCNYTAPIFMILISPFLFREPLTGKKLLCVAAAFLGILLVSGVFSTEKGDVNGVGLALGFGAAAAFVGLLYCNKKMSYVPPFDKVVVQLAASALTVLPYALYANFGKPLVTDVRSVILVLILGIVHTGIAYCFYFGPIPYLPIQTVSLFGYIEPALAVVASALILKEPISLLSVLGAVLILGGAVMSEVVNEKGD